MKIIKTCIIKPWQDMWEAKFNPGLPFDPLTKGMPHTKAYLRLVTMQNINHIGESHLMVYDGIDYIYALFKVNIWVPNKDGLARVIKKNLWYTVEDKGDLVNSAKSKLTSKELAALRNEILKKKRLG
jgi:hypothetical protein